MSLADILDAVLAEEQAKRPQRECHSLYYASDAAACWRQRWYKAREVPPDPELSPDARGILAMDTGTYLHERLQGAISTLPGVEVEVGWRLADPPLGGRADLVVRAPIPGELRQEQLPAVGEIKTVSDYAFRLAVRSGPEPRHVLQAMHSACALELPSVWIIYVSRDSLKVKTWWRRVDHGAVRAERERIASQESFGVLPPREVPGTGIVDSSALPAALPWQCRYCGWRRTCIKDGA